MKKDDVLASRYKIARHIGRGGMQDVYLATDTLLEIPVALKTPLQGQAQKRFSQSAIISARVNHHNVAKTLDYFEEAESVFLVEEFVQGNTLDSLLNNFAAIDPHLGARIFHHLSKGVSASHHAGVVHRDLKPSNIMVEDEINLHLLKITDFGIATLTEELFEEAAKDGDLTNSASGTIKGALPYMAPEMMFRKPEDKLTEKVDIWSLGALMFKILANEYPFGVYLDAAVNVKNNTRKPWPPFMTSKYQYRPLSLELQRIVESCLQQDPALRPNADELVNQLGNLCYVTEPRFKGTVTRLIQNGYSGFAQEVANRSVFFSRDSVYGSQMPSEQSKICYSKFAGDPQPRAHPVVVLK